MFNSGDILGLFLFVIAILIIVFFITRWFWTWYWRINERVYILEKIEKELSEIKVLLGGSSGKSEIVQETQKIVPVQAKYCGSCGSQLEEGANICGSCGKNLNR